MYSEDQLSMPAFAVARVDFQDSKENHCLKKGGDKPTKNENESSFSEEKHKRYKKQHRICEICDIKFLSAKFLKLHNAEKHESGKQKFCPRCDYKIKSFQLLKIHIDSKHPEHQEKKYFCNLCAKGFIFEGSLKLHMTQHKQKEKMKTSEYICDLCGQKYVSLQGLKEHMQRLHPASDSKNFVCEVCAFSALTASKLREHKRQKHEVEKHKSCPHCDYKTPSRLMNSSLLNILH